MYKATLDFESAGTAQKMLDCLANHQALNSTANYSERLVYCILSKNSNELVEMMNALEDEPAKELVESIIFAEENLKMRHEFALAAFARLASLKETKRRSKNRKETHV